MKRIIMMLTVALVVAALIVAMAMPAFADKGGVPNEKACHGQVVKAENQLGTTPHEGVDQLGLNNAGELHKEVKSGAVGSFNPDTGEIVTCPPEGA
jgi:hypothetical protein